MTRLQATTPASTHPSAREDWHKHFQAYQGGKRMTKAAYARAHQLIKRRFIYWCRKFEKENARSARSTKDFIAVSVRPEIPHTRQRCLGFVELGNGKRPTICDATAIKAILEHRGGPTCLVFITRSGFIVAR